MDTIEHVFKALGGILPASALTTSIRSRLRRDGCLERLVFTNSRARCCVLLRTKQSSEHPFWRLNHHFHHFAVIISTGTVLAPRMPLLDRMSISAAQLFPCSFFSLPLLLLLLRRLVEFCCSRFFLTCFDARLGWSE